MDFSVSSNTLVLETIFMQTLEEAPRYCLVFPQLLSSLNVNESDVLKMSSTLDIGNEEVHTTAPKILTVQIIRINLLTILKFLRFRHFVLNLTVSVI